MPSRPESGATSPATPLGRCDSAAIFFGRLEAEQFNENRAKADVEREIHRRIHAGVEIKQHVREGYQDARPFYHVELVQVADGEDGKPAGDE